MQKRIIVLIIVLTVLASFFAPAYAGITAKNLTESFAVSQRIVPEAYHSCKDGLGYRNIEGGPVIYSASAAGYNGYYIKPQPLASDSFESVYKYMCVGARDASGNRIEKKTQYIESNAYWVYMPTEGLIAENERPEVGDGVYFSFYYRSAKSFISPDNGNTYAGEDVSFKTCLVHNSGYGSTNLRNFETFVNSTVMTADGGWHRIEFVGQISENVIDRLNQRENDIPFLLCFDDIGKQSYIEMTGFSMGFMKTDKSNEDNSFNRVFTEMAWHLTKNNADRIAVNGKELALVDGKYKYIVKDSGQAPEISAVSQSGASFEVLKKSEKEYSINVISSGYDFLKAADEDVIYTRRIDKRTGEYNKTGVIESFNTPNASLCAEKYTIILSDNVIDSCLRNIPETELFQGSGDKFLEEEYREWVNEGLPENMVEQVLWGNIAFVADSRNYWSVDKKETVGTEAAVLRDGEMYILSSVAEEIFAVSLEGEYVSAKLLSNSTGYSLFIDPRGFALFGKNLEFSIDESPVKENDIGYRHYKSYYAVSMAIGEITWNEISPTVADYEQYIENWEETMLMPTENMAAYESYISAMVSSVSDYMSVFDADSENIFTDECAVSTKYTRLFEMARCYKTLKNLNRNDIDRQTLSNAVLTLLEHLYNTSFSKNEMLEPTDNWFANIITYPMRVSDTLVLMRDEVSDELVEKYVNTWNIITSDPCVSKYQVAYKYNTHNPKADLSNPCSNYTNHLWRAHVCMRLAVLKKDTPRVNRTLKYLSSVFEFTKNSKKDEVSMVKDGFYEDGSFVFHTYYAYNTGYGNSYAAELTELLCATAGTIFDIRNIHGYENVYKFIENSWIPFMYKNNLTKFVSGRELPQYADALTTASMIILNHAPDDVKRQVGIKLKAQVAQKINRFRNITAKIGSYYSMVYPEVQYKINDFLAYMDTLSDEELTYSHVFYNMDRVVHKKPEYTFMLAMSSERIDRYEAINDYGYTDWYIGDGMTYMLTDDKQFTPGWWSRADRYKIPGTTADSTERSPTISKYGNHNAENEWAGAATDGVLCAASMVMPGNIVESETRLTGKKSYFMLEDAVVCMGSDIKGGSGAIYTTVDNVWQNNSQDRAVADGAVVTKETDVKEYYENPSYVWLNGNRGYVFIGNNRVSCERVLNDKRYVGYWKTSGSNSDPFMTILIEHGDAPENCSYTYVMLPESTENETMLYSSNPNFEVLSQNSTAHAIRIKESGIVMANVFSPTEICGIRINTPCSIILKPYGDGYKIYMSDPTQKQSEISLELSEDMKVSGDGFLQEGAAVNIDVSETLGKTYELACSNYSVEKTDESYNITAEYIKPENTELIFASYKGGRLVEVVASVNGTAHISRANQPDEIKAFLWESLKTMTPTAAVHNISFENE